MKRIIFILCFSLPIFALSQQSWNKLSPPDYFWKNVGNPGFSAEEALLLSSACSPSGQPFVAYCDDFNNLKATVMRTIRNESG